MFACVHKCRHNRTHVRTWDAAESRARAATRQKIKEIKLNSYERQSAESAKIGFRRYRRRCHEYIMGRKVLRGEYLYIVIIVPVALFLFALGQGINAGNVHVHNCMLLNAGTDPNTAQHQLNNITQMNIRE